MGTPENIHDRPIEVLGKIFCDGFAEDVQVEDRSLHPDIEIGQYPLKRVLKTARPLYEKADLSQSIDGGQAVPFFTSISKTGNFAYLFTPNKHTPNRASLAPTRISWRSTSTRNSCRS